MSSIKRYKWRRGRDRRMASVRAAAMPKTAKADRLSKKLGSYIESAEISMNRALVKSLREASRDAREGKRVPLSSIK